MFKHRLRALREAAGLTQEALARRADLSSATVAKLERTGEPSWTTVCKLAKALGVSVQDFVNGEEQAPPRGRGRPKKGKANP